jgi:hypothetical protein
LGDAFGVMPGLARNRPSRCRPHRFHLSSRSRRSLRRHA